MKRIFVVAFLSAIAMAVLWITERGRIQFYVDIPTVAPAAAIGAGVPTNNWVKEVLLTPEQVQDRSDDMRELAQEAKRRRLPGEHVRSIVFSGSDFCWINYEGGMTQGYRRVGLTKDNGRWR
jgi:hypothetical protein